MRIFKLLVIVTFVLLHAADAAARQAPRRPDTGPAGTVTLSLAEYNRLVDRSTRPSRAPDVAPVGAVLARADLRVRVDPLAARGTFTFDGDVLRAGTTRVDLIAGGTVLDARASGRPVPLVAAGNVHAALLPGPGPFSVAVDWGAPLRAAPGRVSFVLPVPAAGSVRAAIDVPGDDTDVHVSSGLITRKTSAAGRTIAEATLDPGSTAEVWWSARAALPGPAARDARLLADVFTLVTIAESELRLASLIDLTVVQGEPRTVEIDLPQGFELSSVTGTSIETSDERGGRLRLTLSNPALRRHQVLVALERSHAGGSVSVETGFPAVPAAERERGEIGVEGIGTLELSAPDRAGIRRVDVREVNAAVASLARQPLAAAFRYRRASAAPPTLALDIRRFPDAAVLAALAERATATTLVNPEGRALTEIVLTLQNRAQPFLKVALPAGASIVSVEVAGRPAKPANGADGIRVPLLRPGFRPTGSYAVSFVYVHAAAPFGRKGEQQMALPKMDIPVGLVEWEVFVPDRFSVSRFGGNMIAADLIGVRPDGLAGGVGSGAAFGTGAGMGPGTLHPAAGAAPGQIVGRATDQTGSPLPGAAIRLTSQQGQQTVTTDAEGRFQISNVPSGQVTVTGELSGFRTMGRTFDFDQQPRQLDLMLELATRSETVTVQGSTAQIDGRSNERKETFAPSANVANLQRRAAGVLPVRVDVPRAGSSLRFVKPLVVDQEAMVTFRYKRR